MQTGDGRRARRFIATVACTGLLAVALSGCNMDFTQAGFDAANSRFNTEATIGAAKVAGLKQHWSVDLGTGSAANTSTPAVVTIAKTVYVFVTTADGHLEKWRADTHTRQWRIPIGDISAAGPWDGPTPSPAVTTVHLPGNVTRTEVIAGSPDGHYYAYDAASTTATDANPPTQYWNSNAGERFLFRAVNSPTITPGNVMFIDFGEFANNHVCFGAKGCWTSVLWSVYGVSLIDGSDVSGWDLGGSMMPTDSSGNVLSSAAQYVPSAVAFDASRGIALVGEPDVFYDFSSGTTRDMTSGVLALTADDMSGTLGFAWESRWDNNGFGVPATPALSVDHERAFVSSVTGLRVFNTSSGGGPNPPAVVPDAARYASPAVAGYDVAVPTDDGYTREYTFGNPGTILTPVWTSSQARVGGVGVPQAAPVFDGTVQTNGNLAGLVFNSTAKGDLLAWDAVGSGAAAADVAAQANGLGGASVSHGCVYVETSDGHLAEWGL